MGVLLAAVWLLAACTASPQRSVADPGAQAVMQAEAGLARLHAGDVHAAKTHFMRALEADPAQPLALLGMGSALERAGDSVGALGWYAKALEVHPNDPYVLTNHGDLACRSGNAVSALPRLQKAIMLAEGRLQTAALVAAGQCALGMGDYNAAEGWLREALDREPMYPEALYGMARVARLLDQPLASRAFLSRLRALGLLPPEAAGLCMEVEQALDNPEPADTCGLRADKAGLPVALWARPR